MRMRNLFLLSIGLGLGGVAANGTDEIATESVLAGEWQQVAYDFAAVPMSSPSHSVLFASERAGHCSMICRCGRCHEDN